MRRATAALPLAVTLLALALGSGGGAAQQTPQTDDTPKGDSAPPTHVLLRPAASLLVPGSGQLLGGKDRGLVYVAIEVFAVARFIQLNLEGRRQQDRYRDLAFAVARRAFAPTTRDTVFEYFETMQRFSESGQFDRDPGPPLAPEIDAATYNGSVWLLARRTFWLDPDTPPDPSSPEYVRAVRFYQDHAVGPNYLWSWRDASLEQGVFRERIRKSDDAFRGARGLLGVLLANHVASSVDALISSRLSAASGRRAALRTTVGPTTVVRLSVDF